MALTPWPQLLAGLSSDDNAEAERAGEALLANGNRALPLILEVLSRAPVAARRRLVFLAGEIGRLSNERQPPREALIASFRDEDWKVRRNAAIGLGKLGRDENAARAILETLSAETDKRVRHSLMLAFGHTASSHASASEFEQIEFGSDEAATAQKARDTLRARFGSVVEIERDSIIGEEATLELWSRSGVADLVAEETEERGFPCMLIAPDRVRLKGQAQLTKLLEIRTALYPVLVHSAKTSEIDGRALGKDFSASKVVREIARITGPGSCYRATLPAHFAAESKREWIKEFAAGCVGLRNAATGYEWELIVRRAGKRLLIGARPASGLDERFAYRKEDRPASLHPTLAAAAARLIRGDARSVVLDPFCGSGSLLAERAKRGPYARLIGWDIDQAAIKSAQVNLHGLQDVSLICVDMQSARGPRELDAIVSNPPYGHRVLDRSRAHKLHLALDLLAEQSLRPGGILIVFRPPDFPAPRHLHLVERRSVDAGGIKVDLLVARKPETKGSAPVSAKVQGEKRSQ